MTVHELSRVDACRIAVRAQLLDSARPAGLRDVVRHLTLLQIDPTAAIATKRRWGYFALPVLYRDWLAGKLDATADPKAGVLRVNAIHQDVPFDKAMTAAVDHEIKDLAHWLGLELMLR